MRVGDPLLHADLPSSFESFPEIPDDILSVIYGIVAGDTVHIDQTSQLSAACIFALASSLGYDASLNTRADKPHIYRITVARGGRQRTPPATVKKVHAIEYPKDAYVYDLTTSNHHFSAGVGRMVVHNTDSVMCILNLGDAKRDDMHAHFEKAAWLASEITHTFPAPVELEFEKCYYPYLLFSKKRYAGLMFTRPETHDKIDVKGLQLVRRDNPPIVKDVSMGMLDAIMFDKSVEKAVDYARMIVRKLLDNEFAIEKFTISKALRDNYKNESQPHLVVAQKIFQRTGERVPSGARVPYVFIEDHKNPDGLLATHAEDPAYVERMGLKLDVLYYLDRQLTTPVESLLDILGIKIEEVFEHPSLVDRLSDLRSRASVILKEAKRVRKNEKNNQREITSFFFKS